MVWQGALADMGGAEGADAGLSKGDVQTLLREKSEALAETLQEVDELATKNRELQAKVGRWWCASLLPVAQKSLFLCFIFMYKDIGVLLYDIRLCFVRGPKPVTYLHM